MVREDRQQKEQRARFGPGLPGDEDYGHKEQQPEQRVVTDFFQQSYHRFRQRACLESAGPTLLLMVRACVRERIIDATAIPFRGVHKSIEIFLDVDPVEEHAFVTSLL